MQKESTHRREITIEISDTILSENEIHENQVIVMNGESKTKLDGLSPRANYTYRATAACRRSDCQLLPIEGATWSA
jgi:hypothetical protein